MKFHVETNNTGELLNSTRDDFFAFVRNLIPKDKYLIFKSLFRYPVYTNGVCGTIFDKLSRVFDSRNPAYGCQFRTSECRDDWEWYRQDVLGEPDIWQNKGWEMMKTEVNSVLIVDMPVIAETTDKYPQPYFYWLGIENVLDFEAKDNGEMEFIIFRQPDNKVAVIDDYSYRIFDYADNELGSLLVENPHGLGYCPARFFWNEILNTRERDIKANPITKMLANLDWLLFFHFSKQMFDLYGAYPILSGYEQECDYTDTETGVHCDGGFLKNNEGHYLHDEFGLPKRCPKCGENRLAGAGSFIEVPVPLDGEPDLRNPIQMLVADHNALQFNVNEEDRLKKFIIDSCVGVDYEAMDKTAVTEKQVDASFENMSAILNRVKKNFEQAQTWVDATICRLRYGKDFVMAKINYGTEFFTLTISELRKRYKEAKDSGATMSELDALRSQIIESEYRHNPIEQQRMLMLSDIEPLRHQTLEECITLLDKGLTTQTQVAIKADFSAYIKRFERENCNVLEFGLNLPYAERVKRISDEIKTYVNESISV